MYKKIEERFLPDINSKGTLYIHKKSGARIITLANDDPNKTFCVSFKTPPKDDSGLTHILEHCVLSGSKKFRSKDPFTELLKGSLTTFLNAMTFPDKTMYPVASINDKDFNNLMEVYMDAVFFPKIHEQDEIFLQEGWHHEIFNEEDDIIYNGVVYNEMKGATSSLDSILIKEIKKSLYPDTEYRFESGGAPEFIPTLSYEDFKMFHKKYYHPSNSYILLYGDMNFQDKLNWLDKEYLNQFDRIDLISDITTQTPFESPKKIEIKYPITKDEDETNKTALSYNILLPKITDIKLFEAIELLSTVLIENNNAIIRQNLIKSGICDDVEVVLYDLYQPFLSIVAKGANKEDEDKFINTINESFSQIINSGVNKDELLAEITFREFKARENKHGSTPKGVIYAIRMLSTYLFDENMCFDNLDTVKYYAEFKGHLNSSYFEDIVKDYFLNNNHKTYVCAIPSKTIADENLDKLSKELKDFKDSLSKEELNALILQNKRLRKFQETPSTKEELDTIPRLSLSDINPNPRKTTCEIKNINDIKVYHSPYWTNGIYYTNLYFKMNHLDLEELKYARLISQLIGTIDTKKRTFGEIEALTKLKSGGIYNAIAVMEDYNMKFSDILFVYSFSALKDNLEFCSNLILEEMFSTNYNSKDIIVERIKEYKLGMEELFMTSGHVIAMSEAKAQSTKKSFINNQITYRPYYNFLNEQLALIENDFNKFVKNIETVCAKMFNKNEFFVQITQTEVDKDFETAIMSIYAELGNEKHSSANIEFVPNKNKLALYCSSNVNYDALCIDLRTNLNYAYNVAANVLRNDYLYQNIRVKGGAYGAMLRLGEFGDISFVSYRDPNIKSTYETYLNAPKFLQEFEVSNEDFENYIIGTFQGVDDDPHVSTLGMRAFESVYNNISYEIKKQNRLAMLTATPQVVRDFGVLLEENMQNNTQCTVGNAKIIEDNKDYFDTLEKLY